MWLAKKLLYVCDKHNTDRTCVVVKTRTKKKIQQPEKWKITAVLEFNAITIVCEGTVCILNCNKQSNWISQFELQNRHFICVLKCVVEEISLTS